jgi:type I restriction enzyme M protein
MKNRQYSEPPDQNLKKFAKSIANKFDIAEYQELMFGLLFMKCASESLPGGGKKLLIIPQEANWKYLKSKMDSPLFGDIISNSLEAFEKSNASLDGLLSPLDRRNSLKISKPVFEFIDSLSVSSLQSMDLFGRIYEYLHTGLGSRKNGQFFTPDCVAKLLVEMLQPLKGNIYDPCCGTGTMFVHVIDYVNTHGGGLKDIAIFGQESSTMLHRICRLNLALRGIDHSNIKWNSGGSLLEDDFPNLKADYILANPPFNDKDWGGELLKNDIRWQYGTPPAGNGNYAWIQHVVFHLSFQGKAAILLPNGSLSSRNASESGIRERLSESGLVDCVLGLPDRLFLNTSIPACVWLLSGS